MRTKSRAQQAAVAERGRRGVKDRRLPVKTKPQRSVVLVPPSRFIDRSLPHVMDVRPIGPFAVDNDPTGAKAFRLAACKTQLEWDREYEALGRPRIYQAARS